MAALTVGKLTESKGDLDNAPGKDRTWGYTPSCSLHRITYLFTLVSFSYLFKNVY